MNFKFAAFATIVMLSLTIPASAYFVDGNALLRYCTPSGEQNVALCLGYIEGTTDAINSFRTIVAKKSDLCPPPGTEVSQIKDATVTYLQSHPAERSYSADATILLAISDNWHCTGGETGK